MAERRKRLIETVTLGWEYHTAHLYFAVTRALKAGLGPAARPVIAKARSEYADAFTAESLSVIDGFEDVDFKVAR